MMTILMIDVEAGKEELFERLGAKLNEVKTQGKYDQIKILYQARCFTHSDISIMKICEPKFGLFILMIFKKFT